MKRLIEQIGRVAISVADEPLEELYVDGIVCPIGSPEAGWVKTFINSQAGELVARELEKKGKVPIGQAVVTSGGALLASYIIHVCVLDRMGKWEIKYINMALKNILHRAEEMDLESLGIPLLEMEEDQLKQVIRELKWELREKETPLKKVVLVIKPGLDIKL